MSYLCQGNNAALRRGERNQARDLGSKATAGEEKEGGNYCGGGSARQLIANGR